MINEMTGVHFTDPNLFLMKLAKIKTVIKIPI